MNQGFEKDIKLEIKFSKQIKGILGNYFFVKDKIWDLENGTDFAMFLCEKQQIRVGTRLRRYDRFLKYSKQFSIRWSRPSGVPTEIDKIRNSLVDYILYGFVDAEERRIIQYFLGDLGVFRKFEVKPMAIIKNNPPDSQGAYWRIDQFPPEFILKFYKLEGKADLARIG